MKRRDILLSVASLPVAKMAIGATTSNSSLKDLAAIGRAALAEGAVPADAASLARALGLASPNPSKLAAHSWNGRVAGELADGDTIFVANWFLSRTEVQICALLAIAEERVV
ncbi:hypothetical protein ACFSUD_15575 [Sulfitobacter aestuarii]|uniref:Uncharacterized protein n=1 Tax=Sulfitobacter aestuarii TaxID=2161676 RepID=A0ABW5U534_9RHOB